MAVKQFRATLKAQPSRPFVMHLADGRAIPVQHPERAVSTSTGRTTIVVQPDDTLNIDGVATRFDMQDLRDVVKDLAGAQVCTEEKLKELADAQKRKELKVEELARRK